MASGDESLTRPGPRELVADGAMTSREFCAWSGLSIATVRRRIADGSLASIKIGKRRLIPRRAAVDFLAAGLEAAPEEDESKR